MEANILQTSNMSGIEKVSSGKQGAQTSGKGNISKKDLLFLNLLSLQQKHAAANAGKTKGKKGNLQNLNFVEGKGKDSEKGKTAAELLAASLLVKQNPIKQNPELLNQKSNLVNEGVAVKSAKASQTNSLLALKSKASLNPKNEVDIDNKIIAQKLAELNEVEAGDTGLKLKQGMAEKQIATTNQIAKNGPQTKGRVFVRGEERFLQSSSLEENSALKTFSATDIKETDQRLKQVGLTGYGLKRISDNIESNEVEGENFATSSLDVGRMNTEVKANASNYSTDQTQANTNFDSIMEQVDNGLKTSYNHQLKEMKLKLQPEELGEIEIKFRIENNMMKAEFVVESEVVKEALESRFNQLKDNLLERGINASEVNVYVSSGNEGKGDNSGYQRENLLAGKSVKSVNSKLDQETLNSNLDTVSKTTNVVDESGVNILV